MMIVVVYLGHGIFHPVCSSFFFFFFSPKSVFGRDMS